MAKRATSANDVDVLVLGEHPSAYVAAAVLAGRGRGVAVGETPGDSPPPHVSIVNPALFDLPPVADAFREQLAIKPIHRVGLIGPTTEQRASFESDQTLVGLVLFDALKQTARTAAEDAGARMRPRRRISSAGVDDDRIKVEFSAGRAEASLLLCAEPVDESWAATLGLGSAVSTHHLAVATTTSKSPGDASTMLLALDLPGDAWGWTLPGDEMQLAAVAPGGARAAAEAMRAWRQRLALHDALAVDAEVSPLFDRPLSPAGAMTQNLVGKRTLLFGPGGGFFAASGEDVYPGCWSATLAAEIADEALSADHPQEVLPTFSGRWGSTLGEYMRGPQQNLRFLLPIVYTNPPLAQRLIEAFLLGKDLVR